MIGKGKSISHTRASMEYGWNQEKDAEVVFSQHLAGDDPRQVTEEFKMVQEQNTRCQKNTLSFVLSPTPEDGKRLSNKQLGELTRKFIKGMDLKERQAIAFIHRNKAHTHIHLYVNRIGFDGKAYHDNFIGKRSQLAAEQVAKEMGLTTAREVQFEKSLNSLNIRLAIKNIHENVMSSQRPRTLDEYVRAMKAEMVSVIPTINKANRLQGLRFEYKGSDFKASEVHRSMSGGRILGQLSQNSGMGTYKQPEKSVKLLGKTVELGSNLATSMAKNIIKKTITRALDTGIGY
ncbi:Relaxase/Mobilisation nuclease domain-containing protein [Flavobacteriaceae bacterium MAR_2010_188]|nr:Relaxase/Mobilisation nuclease domain-containing protein [Flavobacteriaceae bacterium MAR_2010_188]